MSSDDPKDLTERLIVISGPSGSGKTTVLNQLLVDCPLPLQRSVSATTRDPRPGEQDGVHYYFITREQFQKKRESGEFLECFEVFSSGQWYGTLHKEVTTSLGSGKWVVLEIDVQGAMEVLQKFHDTISFFVEPGSPDELERRLRGRGTESEERIQRRLDRARYEIAQADRYQYRIVNHDVDQSVAEICDILKNHATGH